MRAKRDRGTSEMVRGALRECGLKPDTLKQRRDQFRVGQVCQRLDAIEFARACERLANVYAKRAIENRPRVARHPEFAGILFMTHEEAETARARAEVAWKGIEKFRALNSVSLIAKAVIEDIENLAEAASSHSATAFLEKLERSGGAPSRKQWRTAFKGAYLALASMIVPRLGWDAMSLVWAEMTEGRRELIRAHYIDALEGREGGSRGDLMRPLQGEFRACVHAAFAIKKTRRPDGAARTLANAFSKWKSAGSENDLLPEIVRLRRAAEAHCPALASKMFGRFDIPAPQVQPSIMPAAAPELHVALVDLQTLSDRLHSG